MRLNNSEKSRKPPDPAQRKTVLDFYYEAVATIDSETGATVDEVRQKSKVKRLTDNTGPPETT